MKQLIITIAFLVFCGCNQVQPDIQAQPQPQTVTKWEYKADSIFVNVSTNNRDEWVSRLNPILNKLGQDGWELIQYELKDATTLINDNFRYNKALVGVFKRVLTKRP